MSTEPTTSPKRPSSASAQSSSSRLRGDLIGGLVAAVVALPLALAFGVQSGLGAEAGLYGAIGAGIVAALFGGTPTQVTGPTGPMTVVSATVVSLAIAEAGSVESALGIILLTFAVGGVLQIVFGVLGVAKYVRYFPYPVVSGFMSGVGLIIVVLQIWPFLGSDSPSSTLEVITRIGEPLSNIDPAAVGIGLFTVAAFYLLPKVTTIIPPALGALLAGTIAAVVADLDVPVIGDIPQGLPTLQIGEMLTVDPSMWLLVVEYGLILAILGSIDSLLTSVIADNITRTKHDSNRELIGQGLGNLAAALIGGLPGAGATKGTVVNIDAGGTTRLSGTFHGVLLLVMLLGAGSLVSVVPLAVLAGILIPIGFAIVDTKGLKHLRDVPRADAIVLVTVLLITVFGDLIIAVGTGLVMACVLFMKKLADLGEERAVLVPLSDDGTALSDTALQTIGDHVHLKRVYGPLFFGVVARFRELSEQLPEDARVLIIDLTEVPSIDQSGLYAIEDVVLDLEQSGVEVHLVGLGDQPLDMLKDTELVGALIAPDEVHPTLNDAVAAIGAATDTNEGALSS
ncbi:SulP family inorganic anion transporter [Euzebya tangerina]|uniref:SulP family inorganic anion transporter n=1 Tax=Euzebya tangerina TaxID=591198 RepID=UPI00196B7B37|nr:SulP family inorganic anion transporter [Euzebya tangerina]